MGKELDRSEREAVVGRLEREGLLVRLTEIVAEEGTVEAWVVGMVKHGSAVSARRRWWLELSELGWTDSEIAELHGVPRRSVQQAVIRAMRAR